MPSRLFLAAGLALPSSGSVFLPQGSIRLSLSSRTTTSLGLLLFSHATIGGCNFLHLYRQLEGGFSLHDMER